jgi:hypothetical protein
MIKINENVAELCGIIAGDGHLSRYISPKRTHYKISIFGHKQDDIIYFQNIKSIFYKEFGKELLLKERPNCIELRVNSKKILEEIEYLGIPVGNKSGIVSIPNKIKTNQKLFLAFLRGFADTDFSLVLRKTKTSITPRITVDIKSKPMIEDISYILNKLKIRFYGPYTRNRFRKESPYTTYQIDINGHKDFKLWMKHIGFRNYKHLKKIDWTKKSPNQ